MTSKDTAHPSTASVEFMRRAIELSRLHMQAGEGGPFGAVIVHNGVIVGEGWNRVTSSMDPTAHAEVTAIRAACANLKTFKLSGCELYTSCEPCPMCLAATYWARVERVFYGNTQADAARIKFDDEWLYQELAKPIAARSLPMTELSRDEALGVFKEWDQKADKVPY